MVYIQIDANIERFHIRFVVAWFLASWLSRRGLRKLSLSNSGAWAAWFVGLASFASSFRFGLLLILFYQTSSWLTKYKQEVKARLEADHKPGGQRDAAQVLSCSLLATLIAVTFLVFEGEDTTDIDFANQPFRSRLLCAYLGHYACCAGDTWASELGVLASAEPFLITNWFKRVPAGTNGGVTVRGTLASLAGGVTMGLGFAVVGCYQVHGMFWMRGNYQWRGCITLGACAAVLGSLLDSLFGATLQATYYDVDRKCVVAADGAGAVAVAVTGSCAASADTATADAGVDAATGAAGVARSSGAGSAASGASGADAAVASASADGSSGSSNSSSSSSSSSSNKKRNIVHICGRDILTNEQVNLLSVALTTLLAGLAGAYLFSSFAPNASADPENLLYHASYSNGEGEEDAEGHFGGDVETDDLFA